MTVQRFRLPRGGLIDRTQPVSFAFNGNDYQGYRGDTLASALLANGINVVARSFKYHRPRGIMGAGSEDATAFVQLDRPFEEPNVNAARLLLCEGLCGPQHQLLAERQFRCRQNCRLSVAGAARGLLLQDLYVAAARLAILRKLYSQGRRPRTRTRR